MLCNLQEFVTPTVMQSMQTRPGRKVSGPLRSQSIEYGLSYVDDGVLFLFDAYRLGVLCFSAVRQLGHPASHCCDHICMANTSSNMSIMS